jgi:hypothetical protein
MPCYSQGNIDQHRGNGVFESSIRALQQLDAIGYGQPDGHMVMNHVYNPNGAFLPPAHQQLETDYGRLPQVHFGMVFNHLFALANMSI